MRGAGSSWVSWVNDSFESSGILSARSRLFHYIKNSIRKAPETQRFRGFWRRSRDLNPGCDYSHYSLSRGAPSATWVLPHTYLFSGGESGIRTHGTLLCHWFSRPAPSTARPSLHNGTSFVSIPRFHRFVKREFTFFREKCAARGITAAVRRPGAPELRRERQRSWSEKRLRIPAPFPRSAGSPSA